MNDVPYEPDEDQPDPQPPHDKPPPDGQPPGQVQQIRHNQVSAVVPEHVGRGVFSTGAVLLQGQHEFIIDFLMSLTRPHQVAARVILPVTIVPRMIAALRVNLENYRKRFGEPPALPKPPPNAKAPSFEEIYEQLKIPDDVISGEYANTVMISHSASEFCFDFITSFYPRSAVSCRVFLSAPQTPRLLETLTRSFEQYQQKMQQRPQPPAPPTDQPPPPPDDPLPPHPA